MVRVTGVAPKRPEAYEPTHHIGSPPTSFRNPWPSFSNANTSGLAAFRARFARDRPAFVPVPDRAELAQVRPPDWGAGRRGLKTTWIGHASFLLETTGRAGAGAGARGVRILCDPVWSERTSPFSFLGPKRYTPVPCGIDEVPDVDVVVVSHSHYDHCDVETLKALHRRRGRDIHFFVGLGCAVWVRSLGVPAAQVSELDWWDAAAVEVEGVGAVKLTCTPAQHFSGRKGWDRDQTLWCSWVVEEGQVAATEEVPTAKKVFFAGDTGYRSIPAARANATQPDPALDESTVPHCPAFKQVGALLGPFDLSLLPIGLCSPRVFMSPVHCNPADSICLHRDLGSRRSVGMHWGTVRGGVSQEYEDVRDPPRRWREEAEKGGFKWREKDGKGEAEGDWEVGLMDVGETIVLE